jgi:microcystin-dependent protein
MGQPYIGEIRMVGFNFAPVGWELCDGQMMPIAENDALFQLLGTTYGGDGQSTFGLPDLQSRVPLHSGQGTGLQNYTLAETGGVESVTLTTQQTPVHDHAFLASQDAGADPNPQDQLIASPPTLTMFLKDNPVVALNSASILPVGGSQPHDNIQPLLTVNFIISLYGVFPPPS